MSVQTLDASGRSADECLDPRVIEVHSISLHDAANIMCGNHPLYPARPPAKPKQLHIVAHPRAPHLRPIIHEIAAHGGLLIVTIFALDTGGGAGSLQILFVDPETGATKWVDPVFAQVRTLLHCRIHQLIRPYRRSPSCGCAYGMTISSLWGK